jgi:hypothetical protein
MPVTFPDMVVSFKETFSGLLRSYFDGGSHEINDTPHTFPRPEIVFDVRHLDQPIGLTIAFIGDGTGNRREGHCNHPNPPVGFSKRQHAYQIEDEIIRTLVIACPAKDISLNRRLIDQTWGLLFAVLETKRSEFAEVGIFSPTIPLLPADDRPREDVYEAIGIFTCKVRAVFARYELS